MSFKEFLSLKPVTLLLTFCFCDSKKKGLGDFNFNLSVFFFKQWRFKLYVYGNVCLNKKYCRQTLGCSPDRCAIRTIGRFTVSIPKNSVWISHSSLIRESRLTLDGWGCPLGFPKVFRELAQKRMKKIYCLVANYILDYDYVYIFQYLQSNIINISSHSRVCYSLTTIHYMNLTKYSFSTITHSSTNTFK